MLLSQHLELVRLLLLSLLLLLLMTVGGPLVGENRGRGRGSSSRGYVTTATSGLPLRPARNPGTRCSVVSGGSADYADLQGKKQPARRASAHAR